MGPRAKRRLAYVAAAVVVLAVAVAGVMLFSGGSHRSAPRVSAVDSTPASIRYVTNRLKLVYGMTPKQIRQLVGPPQKVIGNCWRYPRYTITSLGKTYTTADGLCFAFGHYSTQQFWMNGKWEVMTSRGAAPVSQ
jgi:hypothetical protein